MCLLRGKRALRGMPASRCVISRFLTWHFPYSNKRNKPKFRNGKVRLRTWEFDSFLSRHFAYSNERKKPELRNGKVGLRTWSFASFLTRHFAYSNERKEPKLRNGKARLPTLHSPPPQDEIAHHKMLRATTTRAECHPRVFENR